MPDDELTRLRLFYRQVVAAAGDHLDVLPDGHAFDIVWRGDNDGIDPEGPTNEEPDAFITAGMIRRAAPSVDVAVDPCLAKRRPDEPCFTLLGRDPQAPDLVVRWARDRHAVEGDSDKVVGAFAIAEDMRRYRREGGGS